MFTGIIQSVGRISHLEDRGGDARIGLETGGLDLGDVQLGDSIAVNGVCLTAVDLRPSGFSADVSGETLRLTTLGGMRPGSRVNLEKALTLSTPLGGHLVSGHVDGLGRILERKADARSLRLSIQAPAGIARYIAAKGSICVDGVSLTVNRVEGSRFELNIVPHTQGGSIIPDYRPGDGVNLEVDLLARYLERLLLGDKAGATQTSGITEDFLVRHGYTR